MGKSIINQQSQMVVKRNELIQKSRYSMPAQQQRVLLFMISKIKPHDEPQTMYEIEILEFCKVCGMEYNSGEMYKDIKNALKAIRDASIWVKVPVSIGSKQQKEILLSWLYKVELIGGTIKYSFHEDMFPYLFDLKEQYTQYGIEYVVPMRSKYSIRLYELLKSLQNIRKEISFSLEELKVKLDAEKYDRFQDLRRYVIESAVNEINTYTDIKVKWFPIQEGRKNVGIAFSVWTTFGAETDRRREVRYERLGIKI